MIFCYEIFLASRDTGPDIAPRLANKFELEGMYDHLKRVLVKIGFINPQNPEHWMLNVRRFLNRLPLRAREVRVVRGICRQIAWYSEQLEKLQMEDRNQGRSTHDAPGGERPGKPPLRGNAPET